MRKFKIIGIILALCLVVACAGPPMTPTQKYAVTRATFNDILENHYIPFFKAQTPEVQQKLRDEAKPVIHEAADALDMYYWSLTIPNDDPDARLEFYLTLKTKLINLVAKYGLKIPEENK